MCGRFSWRNWSAVQDVQRGLRHRFICVGEKDADLPHLGIAELGFEGRHSGETDAVFNFPVSLADGIVADADDIGFIGMGLEQLRSVWIHVVTERGWMAVKAVTDDAAIHVYTRSGSEIRRIGLHVGSNDFSLNASLQRHVDQLAFVWERWIRDSDRHFAVHEVDDDDEWDQNDSDDQSKDEAHGVLRPPQEFIVEHENGRNVKNRRRASKRSQSR